MTDPIKKPPVPSSLSSQEPNLKRRCSVPSLPKAKTDQAAIDLSSSQSGEESEELPRPSQVRKRLNFEVEKDNEKSVRSHTDSMNTTGSPSASQYASAPSDPSSPRRSSKTLTTTESESGEITPPSTPTLPKCAYCRLYMWFSYKCTCQSLLYSTNQLRLPQIRVFVSTKYCPRTEIPIEYCT